jgi:EpsG family
MVVYLSTLLCLQAAAIAAMVLHRTVVVGLLFVCCVFLLFFIGFRDHVSADWNTYIYIYDVNFNSSLFERIQAEADPGYSFIQWAASLFDGDIHLVNFFGAIIIAYGIFQFSSKQPYPMMSVVALFPYYIAVACLGYTRQSIAIGFELAALVALGAGHKFEFSLNTAGAVLMHRTAIVVATFYLMTVNTRRIIYALVVSVFVVGLAYFAFQSLLERSLELYVSSDQYQSDGAVTRSFGNAVPAAIFLLVRNRLPLSTLEKKIWIAVSLMAIVALPMAFVLSTVVDRLSLYILPVQAFVFSRLPQISNAPVYRFVVVFGINAYCFLNLYLWLSYSSFADYWIPYSNYLLR